MRIPGGEVEVDPGSGFHQHDINLATGDSHLPGLLHVELHGKLHAQLQVVPEEGGEHQDIEGDDEDPSKDRQDECHLSQPVDDADAEGRFYVLHNS